MMGYRAQVEELGFVKYGDIFIVKEQKREHGFRFKSIFILEENEKVSTCFPSNVLGKIIN